MSHIQNFIFTLPNIFLDWIIMIPKIFFAPYWPENISNTLLASSYHYYQSWISYWPSGTLSDDYNLGEMFLFPFTTLFLIEFVGFIWGYIFGKLIKKEIWKNLYILKLREMIFLKMIPGVNFLTNFYIGFVEQRIPSLRKILFADLISIIAIGTICSILEILFS